MFEGTSSKSSTKTLELRIWKLGTFLNGLFIGVFPQIILIASDIIRGVITWNFIESNLKERIIQNSDTIMKHRFGNIIFSVISIFVFLIIFILLLETDKLFSNKGLFCRLCKILCCPCPNPCLLVSSSNPTDISRLVIKKSKDLKHSPETIALNNPSNNIEESLVDISIIRKEKEVSLPESIKQAAGEMYYYDIKSNKKITLFGKSDNQLNTDPKQKQNCVSRLVLLIPLRLGVFLILY